jgi:uncharacterized membrane protein
MRGRARATLPVAPVDTAAPTLDRRAPAPRAWRRHSLFRIAMVSLGFAVLIACLFGLMLAWESPTGTAARLRQIGLLHWLVSGNWPAKVGAGLLMLGIGALMRYALLNFDVPATIKLASGIGAATALAIASFALRAAARHRALHLALAGAALGVSYLTAYAAYGFFGFVTSPQALALLVVVAGAAGVFAVTSRAMSVAVLAMTGAYLAPAFAMTTPGPLAVYGYYLAASAIAATMIALRGWRALMHLSFLFTLAGALFFGWTRGFYQPQHYPLMQPLLLALVALHLAMPLLEARSLYAQRGRWLAHADRVYFALLPLVAVALTLAIAPRAAIEGALGLALLSALWSGAALLCMRTRGNGALAHFVVAGLLLLAAGLLALDDVPWLLLALAATVAVLVLKPTLGGERDRSDALTLAVALLGALHVIDAVLARPVDIAFLHGAFAERLAGAGLILLGAGSAQRRAGRHAAALGVLGAGALLLALATELAKLDLPFLSYYVLTAAVAVQLAHAAWMLRRAARTWSVVACAAVVMAASFWASQTTGALTLPALALTLAAAVVAALAVLRSPGASDDTRATALVAIFFAALPWVGAVDALLRDEHAVELLLTLAVVASLTAGRALKTPLASWHDSAVPVMGTVAALLLLALTTVRIERSAVAIATEFAALAAIWLAARPRPQAPPRLAPSPFALTALGGALLIVQAMILRAFGPAHEPLTLLDLAHMQYPALLSLLWALLGGALAGWATRVASRGLWSVGACLLVLAALKVVLVDFSGLGDLGNIVAVIAAGLVFLGVAWLAPMPRPRANDPLQADEFARNAARGEAAVPPRA